MAPSQMGMWQGSLEVFCGAVLNKKSSLPTKKKKRGLDLRSPNTVASPSSTMAFNTFLYSTAPHQHRSLHNHSSYLHSWFEAPVQPPPHALVAHQNSLLRSNYISDFFFSFVKSRHPRHTLWKMLKTVPA